TLWALPVALRPGRSLAFWLVAQPPLFLGACYLVSRLAAGAAVPNRRRWIPVATAGAGALAVVYLAGTAGRVATGDRETPFRPYAESAEPGVRHLAGDV